MASITMVNVFYRKGLNKILVGRLAEKERKIFFEYAAEFIKTGIELSPFKLPLKSGVIASPDPGLFGL